MEKCIWLVTEINVDKPIPEIKDLSEEYDFTQEFKKGESFTRIFGNRENNEIKVVLQMLREELQN